MGSCQNLLTVSLDSASMKEKCSCVQENAYYLAKKLKITLIFTLVWDMMLTDQKTALDKMCKSGLHSRTIVLIEVLFLYYFLNCKTGYFNLKSKFVLNSIYL